MRTLRKRGVIACKIIKDDVNKNKTKKSKRKYGQIRNTLQDNFTQYKSSLKDISKKL